MQPAERKRKLRSKKRIARDILRHLRDAMIDVECGECGAVLPAEWQDDVGVLSATDWMAVSYVECSCGCSLTSFMGAGPTFERVADMPTRHKRTTTGEVISTAFRPGVPNQIH